MSDLTAWRNTAAAFILGVSAFSVQAASGTSLPELSEATTRQSFDTVAQRLEKSIIDNKMGLFAQASASKAAAGRGVKISGNIVPMIFRNDFAVRVLQASVAAGFEAPLRMYVTENADGTTSVAYRTPSTVFSPYRNAERDGLAMELDPIFARIVNDAVSGN